MNIQYIHPADQLVMFMQRIYDKGLTTMSGGNLSIRDTQGNIWITPAGIDKGTLTRKDIICVRPDGSCEGPHKPSSELPFHESVYRMRPDLNAVLHAHPPALVAFSIVRKLPDLDLIPSVRHICEQMKIATYAVPGSEALGVEIGGFVREVCGVKDEGEYAFDDLKRAKSTPLGMLDEGAEHRAEEKIAALKKAGDTAGGVAEIRVRGLKSGFGSPMTYAGKLDARLARALMSIQAVKGVETGLGFASASLSGKDVHDEIFYDGGFARRTNRAGGIEGGMSNGEEIVLRVAMKPIPTLMKGLKTVDVATREEAVAASERSDVCAIFALEIIAEAAVAEVLAEAVAERLGGDTMAEVADRYARLP